MAVTGKKPSEWSAATIAAVQTATGINDKIENVVEDTTPQLGGDLDTQGNVIVGGTAVGSTLSLKSTTADGTLTAKALSVLTGNNGATEAVTVLNNGNVGIGNIAPALVLQGSTVAATPFTIGAGTQAQAAASVAGNDLTLTASSSVVGTASGAAAGGSVAITAGNGSAFAVNQFYGHGGSITLTAGNSAATSYATGGSINLIAGSNLGSGSSQSYGGSINLTSGIGISDCGSINITAAGSQSIPVRGGNVLIQTQDNILGTGTLTLLAGKNTSTNNNYVNGNIYITTQKGEASGGNFSGKNGGLILITLGGGSDTSNNVDKNGGIGGSFTITGGTGGNATGTGGTQLAGNGSTLSLTSGNGGNATGASGTRTGGNSGNITLDIGASGTGATANGTVGYVLLAPTRGNVGVGLTVPTAVLHIKAGTASASSAPLKLTSGTLMTVAEAGAVEFLTDAFYGTITTGAVRKQFAFVESSPHLVNKAASANVRNSHDAEATSTESDYTKVKTITLSKGLLGQQRFLFDIKTSNAGVDLAYGKIYRNGVALGTEQSDTTGSYVTKSEDITQTWLPGDTCELWIKIANASTASVQNFRIAYDDSPTVTVTSVYS